MLLGAKTSQSLLMEAASPAPICIASLTPETALSATPLPEAALPIATPPQSALSAQPVPIQSKEPSLMSKLQAPDKEATVRFTVDMSETLHRKLSMLAAKTGRKKVDQNAGAVGGWFEGGGRVKAIVLARFKVVKKFSKPSKFCRGWWHSGWPANYPANHRKSFHVLIQLSTCK